jgi:MFS family permease
MSPQFHSDASLSSFNVDVDKTSTSCSETSIADTESVAKDFRPGWKFYFAFLSLIILIVMVALDATSLPLALPMMSEELKGSGLESFWSGTSFLVASTIFQTAFGSFSRIFGCKPVLFLSLILFGIGAITASLAQSFIAILAGRCLQGVGGGGIITITEIAVTDMVPLRLRGQWLASISAAWAIGKKP